MVVEEHLTWIGIVSLALSLASAAWTGWLTYLNAKLKAQQEMNKLHIEQAKFESDKRDDKTDKRVDLIWKSNLRRGSIRAVKSDMATPKDSKMTSIMVTDPVVRLAYQPIAPFLKAIRKQYPDPVAFIEEVLKEHGEWIATHICDVLGIGEYECMAMAVSVSEEGTHEHPILVLPQENKTPY